MLFLTIDIASKTLIKLLIIRLIDTISKMTFDITKTWNFLCVSQFIYVNNDDNNIKDVLYINLLIDNKRRFVTLLKIELKFKK